MHDDFDQVGYSYNNVGRIRDVSLNGTIQAKYSCNETGQRILQEQANGITAPYEYADKVLTRLIHKESSTGKVLNDFTHGYDINRNIVNLNTTRNNSVSPEQFTYTSLKQILTSSTFKSLTRMMAAAAVRR